MYEKEEILAEADRISERIKALDTVKDYHNVESQIHQNKNIEQRMKELKKIKSNRLTYKTTVRHKH